MKELINHPWFQNVNWQSLEEQKQKTPYIPNIKFYMEYIKQATLETELDEVNLQTQNVLNQDSF